MEDQRSKKKFSKKLRACRNFLLLGALILVHSFGLDKAQPTVESCIDKASNWYKNQTDLQGVSSISCELEALEGAEKAVYDYLVGCQLNDGEGRRVYLAMSKSCHINWIER